MNARRLESPSTGWRWRGAAHSRFCTVTLLSMNCSLDQCADPGCLPRIQDLNFFRPGSHIRIFFIQYSESASKNLKGQFHKIICFWFFSWVKFPPEYPIRTVSNFFENSRRYSLVKVHHRYLSTTPAANFVPSFASVVDTGGKLWEKYQAADSLKRTWRQNLHIC